LERNYNKGRTTGVVKNVAEEKERDEMDKSAEVKRCEIHYN
jgi:hypothetical protein